jgi:hypothetical protein
MRRNGVVDWLRQESRRGRHAAVGLDDHDATCYDGSGPDASPGRDDYAINAGCGNHPAG